MRKLKLVAPVLVVAALVITAVVGAGGASGAEALKAGYSSKGTDLFQLILQKNVVSQLKAQNVSYLQPVSSNSDPGKQISDIRALVSQGANGIIFAPQDSSAIKPAIEFLNSRKIPSVSLDAGPVGVKVSMVVRADNFRMGADACAWLGAQLKGKGAVLSLQGDYASTNGRDRGEGFLRCMKAKFPKIKITDRHHNWKTDKCAELANTVLASNKKIGGIYMASDTICLAPVLSALKKVGRDAKVGKPGHVKLISIDGSPYALQQIRAGKLDALMSQPLDLYARYAVQYLKEAAAGKTFKLGKTNHNSKIVRSGGNLEDQLPAPLVTKKNASSKALWGNGKAS